MAERRGREGEAGVVPVTRKVIVVISFTTRNRHLRFCYEKSIRPYTKFVKLFVEIFYEMSG